MFKDLKNSIITHFQEMQSTTLFTVEVDRDKIYQLEELPVEELEAMLNS